MNDLVKPKEMSKKLDIKLSTLWKLCRQNEIPHYKVGSRCYRFDETEVLAAYKREPTSDNKTEGE